MKFKNKLYSNLAVLKKLSHCYAEKLCLDFILVFFTVICVTLLKEGVTVVKCIYYQLSERKKWLLDYFVI